MKKVYACCVALLPVWLAANNIQVTDISLTGINTTNKTVQVRFSVSWENSWRTNVGPANWDAAWIFIKYRRGGVGDWKHAWLNSSGHIAATGSTIATGLQSPGTAFNSTTNPGIGAFVHRSTNGNGTFTCSNMQLQWNYGANGVTNTDLVEVQVFANEMVYVPQGEFAAGDPDSIFSAFRLTTINTANATTDPSGSGSLGGMAGGYPTANHATDVFRHKPLVSNYPNGYNAFYCMKYEITQKGYVDFLNSLNYEQQRQRIATDIDSGILITGRFVMTGTTTMIYRNGIKAPEWHNKAAPLQFFCDLNNNDVPNEADDGLNIACNLLGSLDVWAYLWWAGLRPMTELEFEKGCRGNLPAVTMEYAWGSADVLTSNISGIGSIGIFIDKGTANERLIPGQKTNQISITTASDQTGPSRVGIFATTSSNRRDAGAAYYGMMEMTGNLTCPTVGFDGTSSINQLQRNFNGQHGTGNLLTTGNLPDNSNWPTRGIQKPQTSIGLLVSRSVGFDHTSIKYRERGGRGVRTH